MLPAVSPRSPAVYFHSGGAVMQNTCFRNFRALGNHERTEMREYGVYASIYILVYSANTAAWDWREGCPRVYFLSIVSPFVSGFLTSHQRRALISLMELALPSLKAAVQRKFLVLTSAPRGGLVGNSSYADSPCQRTGSTLCPRDLFPNFTRVVRRSKFDERSISTLQFSFFLYILSARSKKCGRKGKKWRDIGVESPYSTIANASPSRTRVSRRHVSPSFWLALSRKSNRTLFDATAVRGGAP